MRITSMDISNKEFKKSVRGYNSDDVDDFLDKISEDYEEIYKENGSLREKTALLKEKLDHYKDIENTIQNTLLLAQNTSEQTKKTANEESELILKKANNKANDIIDKANDEVIKINDKYDKIKNEFMNFTSKYRNFMNTQMDLFTSLEQDFSKNYSIVQAVEEKIVEKDIENDIITEDSLNEMKNFYVKE